MHNNHPTSSQRGFTMLEVLITIVVVAGALLGTAGMQAYGLKMTQGSQFRSQAVFLASNLLERIDANNDGAKQDFYSATVGDGSAAAAAPDCASACGSGEIADFDVGTFERRLIAELPAVSATIARTDVTPAGSPPLSGPWIYTVTINWRETKSRPKGTTSAAGDSDVTEMLTYTISRTIYDRSKVL